MEFPDTGEQCSVEACNQLDFLPLKCVFCLKIFCKLHNLPDKHDCKNKLKISAGYENLPQVNYVCSLSTCNDWELTLVDCPHCLRSFCLKHRHQIDHSCPKYVPPSNPMAEAAAKIQELTEQLLSEHRNLKKVKNEKLAAKVQLMKLKGKAVGSKQIPLEERFFFSISLPKKFSSKGVNPLAIFVSHHWSIGRALDAIAELAQVHNRNNERNSSRLALYRAGDGTSLKPFDITLKELFDKENLYNGQTLILEYEDKETDFLEQFDTYKK